MITKQKFSDSTIDVKQAVTSLGLEARLTWAYLGYIYIPSIYGLILRKSRTWNLNSHSLGRMYVEDQCGPMELEVESLLATLIVRNAGND